MDAWTWFAIIVVLLAAVAFGYALSRRGRVRGTTRAPFGAGADLERRRQLDEMAPVAEDLPAERAASAARQAQVGGSDVIGRRPDLAEEREQVLRPR